LSRYPKLPKVRVGPAYGGVFNNYQGVVSYDSINNYGTINNVAPYGIIQTEGTLYNSTTGVINNYCSIINSGTIENHGLINTYSGDYFENDGTIDNYGEFTVGGSFAEYGTFAGSSPPIYY
jgi:hypothetical protein